MGDKKVPGLLHQAYGYILLVVFATYMVAFVQGFLVGKARTKYKVELPTMGSQHERMFQNNPTCGRRFLQSRERFQTTSKIKSVLSVLSLPHHSLQEISGKYFTLDNIRLDTAQKTNTCDFVTHCIDVHWRLFFFLQSTMYRKLKIYVQCVSNPFQTCIESTTNKAL